MTRPADRRSMLEFEPIESRILMAGQLRVVGYLPEYRYSSFSKIDLDLLTHINYFSISANTSGVLSTSGINLSHLDTVVAAAHAKGVTVSITVGPESFVTLSASSTARAAFASNVTTFCTAHQLDGVDIDWEPPAGSAYANYGLLIDDLHAKTAPLHLLLTAAVNPITHEIPLAATSEMDWLNIMGYDFAPANHSTYTDSINGLNGWATYGVPKSKLVLGVPFYGRQGTSWGNTTSKSYTSITSTYYAEHGVYPSPDLDYVDGWYFNGVTTIEKKAAYVRDNGFGGMMTWELGMDHWSASNAYDAVSLLPVMHTMMSPMPFWMSAPAGSMYDIVNNSVILGGGTFTLTANAGNSIPKMSLTVDSGVSAIFSTSQILGNLSILGTGSVDLKNNHLIIDYSGASPLGSWNGLAYTGIQGYIESGRNGGSWNGAGLITSMASAKSPTTLTNIAATEASTMFDLIGSETAMWYGQTVDATSVLIKYTYIGDANLDGRVNGDDYFAIDSHVALSGARNYFNGDFNFDGLINGDDYFLIDSVIQRQGIVL